MIKGKFIRANDSLICQRKIVKENLPYSNQPKNLSKYLIRIDIYEKATLTCRGKFLAPIIFPFLSVSRLAHQFIIPSKNLSAESRSEDKCFHGQCRRHSAD